MSDLKVLVFRVGGQEYGADIRDVREVIPAPEVTPLPRPRAPVVGVFNLRGTIVTAVDGAAALGLQPERAPTRAIIVAHGERLVGVLVESASEVLGLRREDVRPAFAAGGVPAEIMRGVALVGERAIVLLDLAQSLPLRTPENAAR